MTSILVESISIEELPLEHAAHSQQPQLLPSFIDEQDDLVSLLYLLEDNDYQRTAAMYAAAQAQARREAVAEAQQQLQAQQRQNALAVQLERLLEEDEDLMDLLGRRILAVNGYDVPDISPYHSHYRRFTGLPELPLDRVHFGEQTMQTRLPSGLHQFHRSLAPTSSSSRSSHFIHSAPVFVDRSGSSHSAPIRAVSRAFSGDQAKIALHPVTGVPVLFIDESANLKGDDSEFEARDQSYQIDDDAQDDEWDVRDDSDLDWLGREILKRQQGADVWIIGSGSGGPSSLSTGGDETPLSFEVEEHEDDVDVERSANLWPLPSSSGFNAASEMDHERDRIAAKIRQSKLLSQEKESASVMPKLAKGASAPTSSPPTFTTSAISGRSSDSASAGATTFSGHRRQGSRARAATVMSESEEEQLETVGKVETSDQNDGTLQAHSESSGGGRPKKSVKVSDLRS